MTPDRLTAAARRALDSLNDLIRDHSDPGAEALGARFELEQALLAVEPPADRAALRDRIAEMRERLRGMALSLATGEGPLVEPWAFNQALDDYRDAVLAVLPEPVDRAAVRTSALTDAADFYDRLLADIGADVAKDPRYWAGVQHVAMGLRRMAGEQPTADEARPTLRERHRATWNALSPAVQAARLAALDADEQQDGEDDPLRMSEELCPGFPNRCPNLRTIEPEPGVHLGGVRCGCADQEPQP